jgi:hypothetical protein
MNSLWIDFGAGVVERFDFATEEQFVFFLEGACTVLNRLDLDDIHVYEDEQHMLESYDKRPEILVNPAYVKESA